jgi:hypothetical protein
MTGMGNPSYYGGYPRPGHFACTTADSSDVSPFQIPVASWLDIRFAGTGKSGCGNKDG